MVLLVLYVLLPLAAAIGETHGAAKQALDSVAAAVEGKLIRREALSRHSIEHATNDFPTLTRLVDAVSELIKTATEKITVSIEPASKTASLTECVKLMDDIHYNAADKRTRQNLRNISEGLESIRIDKGQASCSLSFGEALKGSVERKMVAEPQMQSLLKIGEVTGTDKVGGQMPGKHHYETMYQDLLGHMSFSDERFTMVEIGFSTGHSAEAWRKFLPSVDLHEFEIGCLPGCHCNTSTWDDKRDGLWGRSHPSHNDLGYMKLHCGDGTEKDMLTEALKNASAPYVFIDDGSHGADDMVRAFENGWPMLKEGGLYFVEDMAESYAVQNGFVERMAKPLARDLMAKRDEDMEMRHISKDLEWIRCMEQICVYKKSR